MSYLEPAADEYRCVCKGQEPNLDRLVRCSAPWTREEDLLCDACRSDRERREH